MPKGYRTYLPDQELLLPPSLREWLPEHHLVYFVSDVVDQLDLSAVYAVYEKEKRGQPPYDPRLMTKLLVYGYCTGVFSSRRIQKRLQEDVPFKGLAAGNEPDFRTISDFRKIHIETLQNLFEQVLAMALECGAIKLGRVSLDGTKLKANASKHKAMSYVRMQEKQMQLKEAVKQLLDQAAAADEQEDGQYGDKRGDELPEELRRRETRLAKIKAAKKVVEQRARDKAAEEGKSAEQAKLAKPDDKDQYNFTDPESRIMNERRRRVCAGLQWASSGGTDVAVDRRPNGDRSSQRQKATDADGGTHRATIGAASGSDFGRQRVLFGREPGAPAGAKDRGIHRDGQAKAWGASPTSKARPVAERRDQSGSDEAKATDQGGQSRLCGAQMCGGTGVRADQTGARVSPIPAARKRESKRGVGAAVPDA
jgi:transposase